MMRKLTRIPVDRRRRQIAFCFLLSIGFVACRTLTADEPQFSAQRLLAHVQVLADEKLQGRAAGSAFERQTAQYIAEQLAAAEIATPPEVPRFQEFVLPPVAAARRSLNVLAWIEGDDPARRHEIIVAAAHMDHLGVQNGELYPGADDNASGVAVLLEVAAALQQRRDGLSRSILLVFFGSEEIGLVGSRQFVQQCPVDLERIVAMLNIDMIGRPVQDQASLATLKRLAGIHPATMGVVGLNGRPELAQLVEAACKKSDVTVIGARPLPLLSGIIDSLAANRSDHAPFQDAGIPVVFFGSGQSDDYHLPSDTIDKVDGQLMARRSVAIYHTLRALASADNLPPVRNARRPASSMQESSWTARDGELTVRFLDNANSPRTLSGIDALFHSAAPDFDAFDPDAGGASAGLNFEHIISGHAGPYNKFTPRHGPYHLYRSDVNTVTLVRRRQDSPWDVSSTLQYHLVAPHAIDFEFRCTTHSAARFGTRKYAIFFFANYMHDVMSPALNFRGIREAGGPEQWIQADAQPGHPDWNQGGTWRHADAAATEYDDDLEFRLNSWSYDYPRYTMPFYYGRAEHGMVFLLMFDRSHSPRDEIRFSQFKFKLPNKPRPAWDFQYVAKNIEDEGQYGFRGRLIWKPWVSEDDCLQEYERWRQSLKE